MSTISGMFAATGPITFAAPQSARTAVRSSSSSSASASAAHYTDMSTLHRRISELGKAIDEANEVFEALRAGGARVSPGVGGAVSTDALDVDPTPSYSSLDSTEEVNTVPTSYTPFGPSWTGSSTSLATIGGTYDGSSGDDTLRFRVTSRTRTVGGSRDINIRVYDNNGSSTLENIIHRAGDPPGTPIALRNGLTITLGAGDAVRNDEFFIDVSTSVDSEVDPDLAFDGTRNDDPNLEPGLPITAGSFFVNGEEITVAADDTVNTVLDRINSSAAGVTAVYDPVTELVNLEHDTAGPNDIIISGDSSGFLDSMKLTGATVVEGSENGELGMVMQDVDALSTTVAGSITINETEVAIDPGTDSLEDVLDTINATVAGIDASFDESTRKVTIAGSGGTVTIDDGGTNFLGNVLIDPGTYGGEDSTRSSKLSQIMARKASRALAAVETAFEKLQSTELTDTRVQQLAAGMISTLESTMSGAVGDYGELLGDAGLIFDPSADAAEDLMDISRHRFERALRSSDFSDIKTALAGSITDDDDGLFGLMDAAVQEMETSLRRQSGDVGVYLSTYA
jgi:hypothetical protein